MNRDELDSALEKIIFGLVLATIIFSALVTGAVREIDFAGVQLLVLTILIAWAIRIWVRRGHQTLWAPACWVLGGFLVYAVVRYYSSPVEYLAREQLLRALVYAAIFFATLDNLNHQKYAQQFSLVLTFVALALSIYAIWQFTTNSPYVWHMIKPRQYLHRGGGTFICPNHLAGFLEMILPLALAFALAGRIHYTLKVLVSYASLGIVASIVTTVSRGGWLSAALSIAVFFFLLFRYPETRVPAAVVLALLVALGLFYVKNLYHPPPRFQQAFAEPGIDEVRFSIWRPAVEVWKEHFWWGGGPGHFDFYFRKFRPPHLQMRPQWAHNDYLNTLADWGTVGGLFLLTGVMAVYYGFFQSWKHLRRTGDSGPRLSNRMAFVLGAGIGLFAILIHSFFDFNMQIPANALLAVTLAAFGTGYLRYTTDRFWVPQRWPLKTAATALILAASVYLGWQSQIRFREGRLLNELEERPNVTAEETMVLLKKAAAIEPHNFDTIYKIGELLRVDSWSARYGAPLIFPEFSDHRGLAEEAMKWFRNGMKLNPLEPENYVRYGLCLDWLDQSDEATPYFEKALQLDPNNYYILALAGWHFIQTKDFRLARSCLERSARFEWRNPLALSYLDLLRKRSERE